MYFHAFLNLVLRDRVSDQLLTPTSTPHLCARGRIAAGTCRVPQGRSPPERKFNSDFPVFQNLLQIAVRTELSELSDDR